MEAGVRAAVQTQPLLSTYVLLHLSGECLQSMPDVFFPATPCSYRHIFSEETQSTPRPLATGETGLMVCTVCTDTSSSVKKNRQLSSRFNHSTDVIRQNNEENMT